MPINSQMSAISDPLALHQRLGALPRRFPYVIILDIVLIILASFALSSPLLFAPGLTIALPTSSGSQLPGLAPMVVLTVPQDNMILYDGKIYNLAEMKEIMPAGAFAGKEASSVLLIKPSKQVSIQNLLVLCEIAQQHGYQYIQIAADTAPPHPLLML